MKRSHKLLLSYGVIALVLVDSYVVVEALLVGPAEPVDAWKAAVAGIVQALAVGICALYAAYLGRAQPLDTRPNVVLDALRVRLWPILVAGIMAAFSVALLAQAIKCGSQPFPSSRGTPLCGKQ
jgi:hypothetical protein